MDIAWPANHEQRKALVLKAVAMFNGIGFHKQFIHIDTRPTVTHWFY